MNQEDMFVLGRIVAPHGVRGEVRINVETDRPEILNELGHAYVNGNRYKIDYARPHKNVYRLKFTDVNTRDAAELLRGAWLEMPREELPPRPEGSFYISDIIGLQVYTEEGEFLGEVNDVIQPGANDVYAVRGEKNEYMVPALTEVVIGIDLEKGIMTVRLPEMEK